jgi:hypothetical protein
MWKTVGKLVLWGTLAWGAQQAMAEDLPAGAAAGMEWQMLPGESLNSLAALFYPKDRAMQQRFVASTVRLNHEQWPDLTAGHAFGEKTTVQIPRLRDLSLHAAKRTHRKAVPVMHKAAPAPTKPVVDTEAAPPPAAGRSSAEVSALEKRTEERQKQLDQLNQRLKSLEENTKNLQDSIKAKSKPLEEASKGRQLKRVE